MQLDVSFIPMLERVELVTWDTEVLEGEGVEDWPGKRDRSCDYHFLSEEKGASL